MTTEENFVDFKCPSCGEPVSFPESQVGSAQECPACSDTLIVPEPGSEVGRTVPLPIVTPRLKLRRFTAHDWKALLALLSDEEGFGYVDGIPGAQEEEIVHWLESDSHIRLTTPNQILHLAVELQDGGQLVGYAGLWFIDVPRLQARFNLSLHRARQRQGLALEAVRSLLGFCFQGIRLHRVTARCDSTNVAARGLLEKAGLRREGEFVKDEPTIDGGWTNSTWYAVLAEEFRP